MRYLAIWPVMWLPPQALFSLSDPDETPLLFFACGKIGNPLFVSQPHIYRAAVNRGNLTFWYHLCHNYGW